IHAGNVDEAVRELEASLAEGRTRDALVELAMLRVRTGDPSTAVTQYQEALDHITQQGPQASLVRASLLEHLGDAMRATGVEAGAGGAGARGGGASGTDVRGALLRGDAQARAGRHGGRARGVPGGDRDGHGGVLRVRDGAGAAQYFAAVMFAES